jgi:hypothetical protein
MITISKDQMAQAEEKYRVRFHKRVRAYVRKKMPDTTRQIPDSKLLVYIARQDKVAEKQGVTTELGVTKWVCLSLGHGENFYQEPSIKKYLQTGDSPPVITKLDILVDYMQAQKKDPKVKIDTIFAKHGYHVMEN